MNLKYFYSLMTSLLIVIATACSPDDYSLASPDIATEDLVEGIAFDITHDSSNPNIVYLTSKLDKRYQVAWETPQGRFVSNTATLKMPFDGDYEVKIGVSTRGGYVWSNPATFHISDFCAEFVSHYLWTRISGGVGQSKTWQLDLGVLEDGTAKTTYWTGPHWYWNANYTWDHLHSASENENFSDNYMDSDPWEKSHAANPNEVPVDDSGDGADWYWAADYKGNSWMCGLANYGYMTLDLINGANVTITNAEGEVVGKGTYLLDTDTHTITFSDVYPLSSSSLSGRSYKLLYLSDDAMQLIGDGTTCQTSLNYVTKDYFENYVADTTEPEPELPNGWEDLISKTVITSIKWVLSDQNPIDWCNLDGSRMNGWKTPADYPSWLGTPDTSVYGDFSMTLDSEDKSAVFAYPDGSSVSTTYTLDEKGIYTFADAVPSATIISWSSFALDANNQLRIMEIERSATGDVSGMWLGARSSDKDEYTAYHFIPSAGSSSSSSSDPLKAWKKAFCGKTFTAETGAFCDWLNFDLSGGWTAPSSFGTNYTSNSWIWDETTANVAKSVRLSFAESGSDIKASLEYTMADGTKVSESGNITINEDVPSIKFPFDLVDYTGTPASWLPRNNSGYGSYWTTPLASDEWIFISHSQVGNNLSNIDENGFWIGVVSQAAAAGGKDEILAFWFTVVK
jgi:hypothetical protein